MMFQSRHQSGGWEGGENVCAKQPATHSDRKMCSKGVKNSQNAVPALVKRPASGLPLLENARARKKKKKKSQFQGVYRLNFFVAVAKNQFDWNEASALAERSG